MSDSTSPQPDLFAGQVAVDQHRSVWTSTDGRRWYAYGTTDDRGWTNVELAAHAVRLTEVVPATRVTGLEQQLATANAEIARLNQFKDAEYVLAQLSTALDQARREGWLQAIGVLQGVADRTGSPTARWAAGYLAADPDRLGPKAADAPAVSHNAPISDTGAVGVAHNDNALSGCPTCTGPVRETAGMVCQTCGTNHGPDAAAEPSPDTETVLNLIGDYGDSREADGQLRANGTQPPLTSIHLHQRLVRAVLGHPADAPDAAPRCTHCGHFANQRNSLCSHDVPDAAATTGEA